MSNAAHQEHRIQGRYTYSNLDRMCACGHTLGQHTAGNRKGQAGECICHDTDEGQRLGITPCSCEKFKTKR